MAQTRVDPARVDRLLDRSLMDDSPLGEYDNLIGELEAASEMLLDNEE